MSLLLLLKPTGEAVIPEPEPEVVVVPGQAGRPVKKPQVFHFPAGTARIIIRAKQPEFLIMPSPGRARVRVTAARPDYALELTSQIRKQQRTYRAVRDERVEEEFHELVKTAFFLSR